MKTSTNTADANRVGSDAGVRLSWKEVKTRYVGQRCKRRTPLWSNVKTVRVIDVNLGGDVLVRARGWPDQMIDQPKFLAWLNEPNTEARQPGP